MTPGMFPSWRAAFEALIGAVLVLAGCAVALACAWLIVVVVLA